MALPTYATPIQRTYYYPRQVFNDLRKTLRHAYAHACMHAGMHTQELNAGRRNGSSERTNRNEENNTHRKL